MNAPSTTFDASRAILSARSRWPPFEVKATVPLGRALEQGRVQANMPVVVMEVADQALAFSTVQIAFHHVAQGQTGGEPWLVIF